MTKMVPCPHCSKPIIDDTPDLVAEALKPLTEAVRGLPSQFPQPSEQPARLMEVLESVAQAGQHMETTARNWAAQQQAEARAQAAPSHPAPTPELIEHWNACTDCAPAWQKIWDGIAGAARKGYVLEEEATKGYVSSQDAQDAITAVARQLSRAAPKGA